MLNIVDIRYDICIDFERLRGTDHIMKLRKPVNRDCIVVIVREPVS